VEAAVRLLALGDDGIAARLLVAYEGQLRFVDPAALPAELAPSLAAILRRLGHCRSAGSVRSTLQTMRPDAAGRIAADLFELHVRLAHASYH
jgi:hypothetical protein